jgi:hypothetical protein
MAVESRNDPNALLMPVLQKAFEQVLARKKSISPILSQPIWFLLDTKYASDTAYNK